MTSAPRADAVGARAAAERAARVSYGRILAVIAAATRDVALAEDALADAFEKALRTWPDAGIPDNPEGWLVTVARNRLRDLLRSPAVRDAAPLLESVLDADDRDAAAILAGRDEIPDKRLELLFACAHPAIDPGIRTPLMLQVVLGLDAATIAHAFLTLPATMGQRLSRAKTKIRDAAIAFEIPDRHELPERLDAVLDAIYAAYGSGWDDVAGADPKRRGLTQEAIWLARVLLEVMPDEPEARGLLALMLFCEARRPARRSADGAYVPILEQDTQLWSSKMIREAEVLLDGAASQHRAGRFQLEAALQSAHIDSARTGETNWPAIAVIYEGLVRAAPTIGAYVGRAAALAEARGATDALSALDVVDPDTARNYQPYWAVRAHVLSRLGRNADATIAFDRAIELTADPAIAEFLAGRREHLSGGRAGRA